MSPEIAPQYAVSRANMHNASLYTKVVVGTWVQMTVVWVALVGQIPQFDERMLYWTAWQIGAI